MILLALLFVLLNWFPLHENPDVSAALLPDQLVVKIPMELTETLCFVVQILAPDLDAEMDRAGITRANRSNRGGLLRDGTFAKLPHPLVAYALHSEQNFRLIFLYAAAYSVEFERRYGKACVTAETLNFIARNMWFIRFEGDAWRRNVLIACGSAGAANTTARRREELRQREKYFAELGIHFYSVQGRSSLPEFYGKFRPQGADIYARYRDYLNRFKTYALCFLKCQAPHHVYDSYRIWDVAKRAEVKKQGIPLLKARALCSPPQSPAPPPPPSPLSAGTK